MVFNDPSTVKISRHFIERWQHFPNSTIANRPLYIYHRAFSPASASQLSRAVKSAGIVEPQWTYSMYKTAHFHSTTAEILFVVSGAADMCFGGGLENPKSVRAGVEAGDVIVIPPGVGHNLVEEKGGGGFSMMGCYPPGKEWDMCYGKPGEDVEGNIKGAGWLKGDPVWKDRGPVVDDAE